MHKSIYLTVNVNVNSRGVLKPFFLVTAKTPRVFLYIVMFSFDIQTQMLMFTKLIVLEVDTMTLLSVESLHWISRIPDHTTQRK